MKPPLRLWAFNYSQAGVLTELPCYVHVRARTKTVAERRALAKAIAICESMQTRWEWAGDGPWKPVKTQPVKVTLYDGYIVKPHRKRKLKPLPPEWKDRLDGWSTQFLPTILSVIENAPSISELFKTHPMDLSTAPSIPLVFSSHTRRKPTWIPGANP